jgi:hypothetical protein
MRFLIPLVLLPYVLNIISKVATLCWDRPLMEAALRQLAFTPRPPGTQGLDSGQIAVIVRHISVAQLKSATILTTFTSSFAGFLAFYDIKEVSWSPWLLWLLVILGACLLVWIYPKNVEYFSEKGWLGIDRDVMATFVFCLYDLMMGILSIVILFNKLHVNQR